MIEKANAIAILCDFDGTISTQDIAVRLLDRFAAGRYEAIDERYESGGIGSKECLDSHWRLLEGVSDHALIDAASEVPLDPGFADLVAVAREIGATLCVVSDGLGLYVEDRVGRSGARVVTNGRSENRTGEYPYASSACACAHCGTCKVAVVEAARNEGRRTVLIGDGTSDRHAAAAADLVFAKDGLRSWCERDGIDYVAFASLSDVACVLRATLSAG